MIKGDNFFQQATKVKSVEIDTHFLSRCSLLLFALSGLALLSALLGFQVNNPKSWFSLVLLSFAAICCLTAWLSVKKGGLSLAAGLLVGMALLVNTYFFLTNSGATFITSLCIFMLVAVLAMLTLGVRIAYAVVIWGNLATLFIWTTNGIAVAKSGSAIASKVGFDDLILLICTQFITIWLVNYLASVLRKANQTTKAQAFQLAQALSEIESKRQLGEQTGQQVLSLSAQLHATANQQASGSKDQVEALAEVTAFVEELTKTSQLIAGEANRLKEASLSISNSTRQAKVISFEVKQVSHNSAKAVKQTAEQNQRVNELYQSLHRALTELAESQGEIRQVIKLIRELGNQTHLLALNAALEAAAAGQYGERFGVVAREVKALADRSVQASHQVSQILGFVENRIEQATFAAQSGYEQTHNSLKLAQDSGILMRQLIEIIESNNREMEQIEFAARQMNTRASEISYATNQQYSASVQGVEKLQIIGTIATQTASGSHQITSSTYNLEELAQQLLKELC